MKYRRLGASGIEVSLMSLGSWMTFEFIEEGKGMEAIAAGLAAGVNFLDDARYDDRGGGAPLKTGYSEVVFGKLFRKGGWRRGDVVIANKAWLEFYPEQSIAEEVEGSLARLGMDYIDVVYTVAPVAGMTDEELALAMGDLIAAGKIRCWGGLNWPPEVIRTIHRAALGAGVPPPVAMQLPYSVLYRGIVEDPAMTGALAETGISVVASAALAGGLLTGKYGVGDAAAGRRYDEDMLTRVREAGVFESVDTVIRITASLDCTPGQLALAFCLKNEQVSSLLFGATGGAQVLENIAAIGVMDRLDEQVMEELRAFPPMADVFMPPETT